MCVLVGSCCNFEGWSGQLGPLSDRHSPPFGAGVLLVDRHLRLLWGFTSTHASEPITRVISNK